MKLFKIYNDAFDASADQEIIRAIKNKKDAAQYVKDYADGAFGITLSDADAIQIAEVYFEWKYRLWDPDYEAQYDRIVREQLDTPTQKGGATMTTLKNNFHGTEYRSRKSQEEIDRIANTWPADRTPAEKAFVRRVRDALCGAKGCQCGDELGIREY